MAYIPVGLYVYPLGPGCVSTHHRPRQKALRGYTQEMGTTHEIVAVNSHLSQGTKDQKSGEGPACDHMRE